MKNHFDYSKTMMMKITLALPDLKGGSQVFCTFDEALEIIKQVDSITCGCPKIIYLAGWQDCGHDDLYPVNCSVNKYLKRQQDASAKDSLLWLIDAAKQYHTVVSFHVNFSDAYPQSPAWGQYTEADLILKKRNGKYKVTGRWNGRNAYQVRFQKEWESGYFKKRADDLLRLVPVQEAKTVHIDAFFVRKGKNTAIAEEKAARRKMIGYFRSQGIDVTSEFIYREKKNGFRAHFGKSDCIELIPAYWNPVFSRRDLLKYPAAQVAGGMQCKQLTLDKSLEWLFYGNIHGEDIFLRGKGWQKSFIKDFFTYNVPYFYLNGFVRQTIKGFLKNRKMHHSDGVVSKINQKMILKDGVILKQNDDLCLPVHWVDGGYLAYSEKGGVSRWQVLSGIAEIFIVDERGKQFAEKVFVKNNLLCIDTMPETAYYIEIKQGKTEEAKDA